MDKGINAIVFWIALLIGFAILWNPFNLETLFEQPILFAWISIILLYVFILLMLKSKLYYKLESKTQYSPKLYQLKINFYTLFIFATVAVSIRSASIHYLLLPYSNIFSIIGILIFLDSLFLISVANWSMVKAFYRNDKQPAKHELIVNGPYSIIRHPHELGMILLLLSCSLTFCSIVGLFFCVCFIVVSIIRINDEEIFLKQEFGNEWRNYIIKTWRLIPYIY